MICKEEVKFYDNRKNNFYSIYFIYNYYECDFIYNLQS